MKLLPHRRDPRVESEEGQASFRLTAALLALAAFTAAFLVVPSTVGVRQVACVLAYAGYAYAWGWLVSMRPAASVGRQWSALALDHLVYGMCFGLGGSSVAALSWVSVTTSVGHGLRYGEARGIVAALVGGLAICCAVMWGPGWNLSASLTIGMTLTAVVAPIYVTRLVHAIQAQRREAEARAATLEQVVHTDALTGVLSRRGFEAAWSAFSDASGLCMVPVGLVYLDLDGFKAVNDTRGHDVGDEVLRQVARELSQVLRSSDSVARMGGDEFVILVRGATRLEDVEGVATKAVARIAQWAGDEAARAGLGASAGAMFAPAGTALASALVLIRALFCPNRPLLPYLYRLQSLEELCLFSGDSVESPIASLTSLGMAYFRRDRRQIARPLSWMYCFPSARRMWASVYHHGRDGRLGLQLPIAQASLLLKGFKHAHNVYVTGIHLDSVTALEEPFEFAPRHPRTTSYLVDSWVGRRNRGRPQPTIALRGRLSKLSNHEWDAVKPILEETLTYQRLTSAAPRAMVDGVLQKLCHGTPWKDTRYPEGVTHAAASAALHRWRLDGRWTRIEEVLRKSRGLPPSGDAMKETT